MQSRAPTPFLTIGTRGSPLALAQAEEVRALLCTRHAIGVDEIAICVIKTSGDRTQSENLSLADLGGKGLFSRELEMALFDGVIDLAVHSAKDMATRLPDGLVMPFFLKREDVRDAFVSLVASDLMGLKQGAIVGTSSIRRRAQVKSVRPDLKTIEFRGNVGTRLKKLQDGLADATLLAVAGLKRTGAEAHISSILDGRQFPPAPAQGAIGLEFRAGDQRVHELTAPLADRETGIMIAAERALLLELDGSCRTPVGALSTLMDGQLSLFGQILSLEGDQKFEMELQGASNDAVRIGRDVGRELVGQAGPSFIDTLKQTR